MFTSIVFLIVTIILLVSRTKATNRAYEAEVKLYMCEKRIEELGQEIDNLKANNIDKAYAEIDKTEEAWPYPGRPVIDFDKILKL
jgi:hypothetical protein